MAVMNPVPVFMRLGAHGPEYEIGSFTPEVQLSPLPASGRIGEVAVEVDIGAALAALLREAADEIEKVTRGD